MFPAIESSLRCLDVLVLIRFLVVWISVQRQNSVVHFFWAVSVFCLGDEDPFPCVVACSLSHPVTSQFPIPH